MASLISYSVGPCVFWLYGKTIRWPKNLVFAFLDNQCKGSNDYSAPNRFTSDFYNQSVAIQILHNREGEKHCLILQICCLNGPKYRAIASRIQII
jgi:hypothetical protein